jgi:hypothetical protein
LWISWASPAITNHLAIIPGTCWATAVKFVKWLECLDPRTYSAAHAHCSSWPGADLHPCLVMGKRSMTGRRRCLPKSVAAADFAQRRKRLAAGNWGFAAAEGIAGNFVEEHAAGS